MKDQKETYVPTTDNWYPNYSNNTVLVRYNGAVHPLNKKPNLFRVIVRGADDYILYHDFETEEAAINMYDTLVGYSVINQNNLFALGFETF